MSKKLLDSIPVVYGATITTPANLTATAADNAGVCNIQNIKAPNLVINYVPASGQTNRYITVSVKFTNDKKVPTSGSIVGEFGVFNVGTGELDIYNSTFVFPGSKTTTGGTQYTVQVALPDVAARWMEVSVVESGSANFGTILIEVCGYEDY